MEINDVIKMVEDKMFSKYMVVQLSDVDVTDYERGRIYGQIEMISKIKSMLESNDDEDNSLQ